MIKGITVGSDQVYIVDYVTFEYTESLTGDHVHFFFNTVPPDQAGRPADGDWYVWGGPRPFNRFRLSDRPEAATQMCVLAANPDHSVRPESGNCFTLPDIVVAAPIADTSCLAGPGPAFPPAAPLSAGQLARVLGISPDEGWWNIPNPQDEQASCWLPRAGTTVSGDLSLLPLVEPPEAPAGLSVVIRGITLDGQGRYVVDYAVSGFTEQLPGTHLHFFFDTVPPEQVGMTGGGSRLMFGGPAPFTGYRASDRPPGASQLCALVASPDHSVILGSGNCFKLPP